MASELPPPPRWTRDPELWLVLAVAAAQLVPVWATGMLATQDGPSHLENAWWLRQLWGGDPLAAEWYAVRAEPLPNWFSHATMALGLIALPPALVERLWLSGYVVLFGGAAVVLARGLERGRPGLALLWLPFVHNLMLGTGFYNFAAGMALSLAILAWWWPRRDRPPDWRAAAALSAALLLLYSCHLLVLAVAMLTLAVLAAASAPRDRRRWVWTLGAMAPAAALAAWYLAAHGGEGSFRHPLAVRAGWLLGMQSLQSYAPVRELPVGPLVGALILGLAVATLVARSSRRGGRLELRLEPRDGFAGAAAAVLVLWAAVPDAVAGGTGISHRLALLVPLLLVAWLRLPRRPWPRRAVLAVAAALALAQAGLVTAFHARHQPGLRELTSGTALVQPGETVLPVILCPYGGESVLIQPYLHAASHYALRSGAVVVANYEAHATYFPLRYRDPARDAYRLWGADLEIGSGNLTPWDYPVELDWVLIWCPREPIPITPWLDSQYERVHAQGRLELYRRRR